MRPRFVGASISFAAAGDVCKDYGPQAPGAIDNRARENKSKFSLAPGYTELNLCDLQSVWWTGKGDNGSYIYAVK